MTSLLYVFLLVVLTGTCLSHPQYPGTGETVQTGVHQCGHASYDCVPFYQCENGVITTDGRGNIDIRVRPQEICENVDDPESPGICCLIPGAVPTPEPVQLCPDYQECVDYSQCDNNGNIITDGRGQIDIRTRHTSCFLASGIGGICCNPPPIYVDVCPGNSVCTLGSDCLGTALDISNNFIDYVATGQWTLCSYGTGDGVCCIPPILDVCPGKSVCLNPSDCTGTALDTSNNFVEYVSTGIWTHCSAHHQGVCCINVDPILTPASKCGVRNYQLDQRISSPYADNEAAFGEFPWQSIIFYKNSTFKCGASLISHKHVLTAAHCVHNLSPGDIQIRFGEWQVNAFNESLPYVDRYVVAIHTHPEFNPENVHNDIAVLELVEPPTFEYHINTICLPSPNQIFEPYTPCIATGWGKDSFTGTFQTILKKIDLPYIERQYCQNLLRKTRLGKHFILDDSFICAGGEENKDACYGDGGGPLICKNQTTEQYVQVGITSWGIGCGTKDVPGVYADVAGFRGWVDQIVVGSDQQQTVPGYGK